jgi:hypothetical protein
MNTPIKTAMPAPLLMARYNRIFGDWCRRCRSRHELEMIHLFPYTPLAEATLDEVMVVCSGCKESINARLREKRPEDLGPPGPTGKRSRRHGAAWNAPAARYPTSHPGFTSRVPISAVTPEGLRRAPSAAKKRRKPTSTLQTKKVG